MKGRIKRPEGAHKTMLPLIGKIKTGYKTDKGPRSTDYFIPSGKYEMHFMNAYGNEANIIQVVFIDDDFRNVCFERYEYRDQDGKLFASGDGEIFKVWNEKEEQYIELSIEDYPDLMDSVKKRCKSSKGWETVLTLRFIIPAISGIVGYWEFSTKGEASSIPQIRDTFDMILENRGFVRGIIFDLSVQFAKSQKPGSKSRYPVVSLIPNQSEENVEMIQNNILKIDNKNLLT